MCDIIQALDRFGNQALLLGRVGENRATRVLIDVKSILSQYPDAIASITVKPPGRAEYPAAVKQEGGILTWEITSADIGDKAGSGQAQITIQDADGTVIKTAIACTRIGESLGDATAPAPDPVETWLDKATGTLADVKRAGNAAQAVADEVQRRLDNGDFVGPQGPQGDTGATGEKGEKGDPGKDAPQEVVRYTAQTLDDAQKAQARENIGAVSATTVSSLKTDVDAKINQSDALTLEEIMASTDLSKKVASAEAVKSIKNNVGSIKSGGFYSEKTKGNTMPADYGGFIRISGGSWPGSYYSDTYYVGVSSSSNAFLGIQINGAKQITWVQI